MKLLQAAMIIFAMAAIIVAPFAIMAAIGGTENLLEQVLGAGNPGMAPVPAANSASVDGLGDRKNDD